MSTAGSSLWWKIVAGTNKKIMFTYVRLKGNNRSNGFCFLIIYVKSQNLSAMHCIPISLVLVWSTSIVNRFSLDLLQFWRRAGFQQLGFRWGKEFNCLRQKLKYLWNLREYSIIFLIIFDWWMHLLCPNCIIWESSTWKVIECRVALPGEISFFGEWKSLAAKNLPKPSWKFSHIEWLTNKTGWFRKLYIVALGLIWM